MDKLIPEWLYHYTNVSSLALILKNQNIKFNPLTVLDDTEEHKVKDNAKYLGKYCFVSSWTNDSVESIPMWKMYSNLEEGIRICLPVNPFKEYSIGEKEFCTYTNAKDMNIQGSGFKSIIPAQDYFGGNFFIPTVNINGILDQVIYTNDKDKLEPRISSVKDNVTTLSMGELGRYKNKYWSFQNEWRYKLQVFPFGYKEMSEDALKNSNQNNLLKLYRGVEPAINYYFLRIDEGKFQQMSITLSPKISEGNRLIVKLLVEKFNPAIIINESDLSNKLR